MVPKRTRNSSSGDAVTGMAVRSIAFTMYPVTDMPRAIAFYRDMLGLTPAGLESDFWYEFGLGEATFGIGNFEQVGTAGSAQSLALEVDDLAALRSKLSASGIETSEPHDFPSCSISVVRDPDGNQIWLHQAKPS
jgi:predicted enzyme related to lactoylglutathione lyase